MGTKEECEMLAIKHTQYMSKLLHRELETKMALYKDAFVHGFEHGYEKGVSIIAGQELRKKISAIRDEKKT